MQLLKSETLSFLQLKQEGNQIGLNEIFIPQKQISKSEISLFLQLKQEAIKIWVEWKFF